MSSLLTLAAGAGGIVAGLLLSFAWNRYRKGPFFLLSQQIIRQAESEAEKLRQKARLEIKEEQLSSDQELALLRQKEQKKALEGEERLKAKEEKLGQKTLHLEKKWLEVEAKSQLYQEKKEKIDNELENLTLERAQLKKQIEESAHFTAEEAKKHLLESVKDEVEREAALFIKSAREKAASQAEIEGFKVIATAMQRLTPALPSDLTVSTVALPSDEMKGRIIGREGRNIRALEEACGVNLILDETPKALVISSFDPLRREIAKMALTELVADGRIHPTRIEEAVEKARTKMAAVIKSYGEDAALKAGALHLHPEMINLLGKLKFRFSLGQNVLDHSIEVSHLMRLMAAELKADTQLAARIGLLHDIGKAVSQEIQGSHAIVGKDLALKWGEKSLVANGIGCHHGEIAAESLEASLCNTADAISALRLGARNESAEVYIKRLHQLESLALATQGVEKAFALQAGREIRVFAEPQAIPDEHMTFFARELAKKIEKELDFPGKIRVTLIREKRVVDYAM